MYVETPTALSYIAFPIILFRLSKRATKSNLKLKQAHRLDKLFIGYNKISNDRLNEIETLWNELKLESFDGEHV